MAASLSDLNNRMSRPRRRKRLNSEGGVSPPRLRHCEWALLAFKPKSSFNGQSKSSGIRKSGDLPGMGELYSAPNRTVPQRCQSSITMAGATLDNLAIRPWQ
jgi:hypothetical protein